MLDPRTQEQTPSTGTVQGQVQPPVPAPPQEETTDMLLQRFQQEAAQQQDTQPSSLARGDGQEPLAPAPENPAWPLRALKWVGNLLAQPFVHPVVTAETVLRGGAQAVQAGVHTAAYVASHGGLGFGASLAGRLLAKRYVAQHGNALTPEQQAAAVDQAAGGGDHFMQWYASHVDKTADEARQWALGADATEGPQAFIQGVAQFATGMALTPEVTAPKLIAFTARSALAGSTYFTPSANRLSNLVANGPEWFGKPVGQFLAFDETSDEITNRLRAAGEETILGPAFYAGTEAVSGAMRWLIGANKARAFGLSARAARTADAAAKGKLDPELASQAVRADLAEARRLSGLADDGATVQSTQAADGSWTLKASGTHEVIPDAPTFRTQAEADVAANSINTGARNAGWEGGRVYSDGSLLDRRSSANMEAPTVERRGVSRPVPKGANLLGSEGVPEPAMAAPHVQAAMSRMTPEAQSAFRREVYSRISAGEDPSTVADRLLTESSLRTKNPSSVDESLQSIATMADALPPITDASGNPIVSEARVQLTNDLMPDVGEAEIESFVRSAFGDTEKLPQHLAATRMYINQAVRTAKEMARVLETAPGDPVAANNAADAFQTLYNLHEALSEHAGTPRAVRAAQQKIIEEQGVVGLTRRLTAARGHVFEGRTPKEIRQIVRQVLTSDSPSEVFASIRQPHEIPPPHIKVSTWLDRVNAYRMEAMLSGPKTQIVNAVSNTMAMLQRPVEMWWAGAAPWRYTTEVSQSLRQAGWDHLSGIFQNLGESWKMAKRSWLAGENTLDPGRMHVDANAGPGMTQTRAWGDASWWQRIYKMPSRTLMGTDEFFAQMNYRMNVRSSILRQARAEGVTDPRVLATRLVNDAQLAFNPNQSGMNPAAIEYSRVTTFKNDLGQWVDADGTPHNTWGASLQKLANDHPFFRQIMPFQRTPVNLARWTWERTPVLANWSKVVQADLEAGGERAAIAHSKLELGGVMYGTAALLAATGVIVGGGPTDPKLRREWLGLHNVPYSMNLGPLGRIQFRRGDPVLTPFAITADFFQAWHDMPPDAQGQLPAAMVAALSRNIASKTFMQGITEFLTAATSGDPKSIELWWRNYTGSYVPNLANQINPDDVYREVNSMWDEAKSRIPGFSTTLEPRRNLLGQTIMPAPGYLNNTFNPFTWSPSHPAEQPISEELIRLGRAFAMPGTRFNGVDLTDRIHFVPDGTTLAPGEHGQSPYDRWMELLGQPDQSGQTLLSDMIETIKSDEYQASSPGTAEFPGGLRYQRINAVMQAHIAEAFAQMLQERKGTLLPAITQRALDEAGALTGQQDTTTSGIRQFFQR